MKNFSREPFDELVFLATIQPQIIRIRKLDTLYPEWSAGMIAVVTGGREWNDDGRYYLSIKFYPFVNENEKIALTDPIYKSSLYLHAMLSNKTGHWVPFYQGGKCIIDRRFKMKPYYGEL